MGCLREVCGTAIVVVLLGIQVSGDASHASQVPLPYASAGYETSHEEAPSHESPEAHSPPGTYLQHYNSGPQGYKVQSGFEGYIVPAMHYGLSQIKPSHAGITSTLLAHVQPILWHIASVLPKVAVFVVSLLALLIVGTLLSSCVCAFTPLCHMSFLGVPLTGEKFRGFMTQDRLTELVSFVQSSIKKYQEMNAKKEIEPESIDSNNLK